MSVNAEREQDAVAFQLLGFVGDYENHVCARVEEWPLAARLREIDPILGEMQVLGGILPHLAPAWARFHVSHVELLEKLMHAERADSQRLDWLEAHMAAILQLEAKCLDVLAHKA
ncbi:hypothetical protein [Ramlibacter albus]|uniref:Uncharacterized protein n=1 Tax=Ramlibacter albus TaxID=2079448 RepID=A0A923M9G5_9BURK|nr:hypothetical protein [Ramlibacter albus]MBC5765219.1 hypothetical protein [Ramlibacter albus]